MVLTIKRKRENTESDVLKKWNRLLEFFYSRIFHNSTTISSKCFMNLSYTNTHKGPTNIWHSTQARKNFYIAYFIPCKNIISSSMSENTKLYAAGNQHPFTSPKQERACEEVKICNSSLPTHWLKFSLKHEGRKSWQRSQEANMHLGGSEYLKESRSLNPPLPFCIRDTQNTAREKTTRNSSGLCGNPHHSLWAASASWTGLSSER